MALPMHLVGRRNGGNKALGEPRAWGSFPVRESRPIDRGARTLLALLAGLLLAGLSSIPGAQAQAPSERQVKAAFLYNFAKFVEWPPDRFADPQDPLVLCVTGEDPFGTVLDGIVLGKTANGHPLALRRLRREQEARGCQILFVSASERKRLRPLLESLKGTSILTVGESDGFAQQGVMINFILEENRVHFEINVDAAERAGLKISSRLLSLAKVVRGER